MKLDEVLALRPPEGSDSATVTAAIRHAETRRAELLAAAATADQVITDGLLSVDDRALARAEQEASLARRAAERIDALLPRLRLDLEEAVARGKMSTLHAHAAEVVDLMADMARWQAEKLPAAVAAIREGLRLNDALYARHSSLPAAVEAAYRDPAVRELGTFAPDLTAKGVPDMARLPRNLFSITLVG